MRFKEYFKLYEGGHAIKTVNINGIMQKNVRPTIEYLEKIFLKPLGLTKKDWAIIGSAGKKEPSIPSGDIDIAIDYRKLLNYKDRKTLEDVYNYLVKELKKISPEVNYIKGANIISFAFPIQGEDQKGQFVQIDIMLTDNLKYTQWAYYGPSYLESQYKGVYRNLLLFAIMKTASLKIRKTKVIDGEEVPVEIEKLVLNLSQGLTKIIQSRESKKDPEKLLKNYRTIAREFLSKDPDEIIKYIIGDEYTASDVQTFEQLWKIINSKNFKLNKNKVIEWFKKYLEDNKLPYPKELKR